MHFIWRGGALYSVSSVNRHWINQCLCKNLNNICTCLIAKWCVTDEQHLEYLTWSILLHFCACICKLFSPFLCRSKWTLHPDMNRYWVFTRGGKGLIQHHHKLCMNWKCMKDYLFTLWMTLLWLEWPCSRYSKYLWVLKSKDCNEMKTDMLSWIIRLKVRWKYGFLFNEINWFLLNDSRRLLF